MDICPATIQCHISSTDLVPKIFFTLKYGTKFCRKDAVLTIRVIHMLYQQIFQSFLYIQMRLGNTSAAMGVCPYCTVSHWLGWRCDVRNMLFCLKIVCLFGRKYAKLTIIRSDMLSGAIPIILIHPNEGRKHFSSNECLSLPHSIIFPGLIWCQKYVILLENSVFIW